LVWNHALYFAQIAVADQRRRSQIPFSFLALRRQDVTQVRTSPLHLPGRRQFEALGSAFVGFQFRHKVLKSAVSIWQSAFNKQPGPRHFFDWLNAKREILIALNL
jgi:hypothetical protein